jgi:hypothetical protein
MMEQTALNITLNLWLNIIWQISHNQMIGGQVTIMLSLDSLWMSLNPKELQKLLTKFLVFFNKKSIKVQKAVVVP